MAAMMIDDSLMIILHKALAVGTTDDLFSFMYRVDTYPVEAIQQLFKKSQALRHDLLVIDVFHKSNCFIKKPISFPVPGIHVDKIYNVYRYILRNGKWFQYTIASLYRKHIDTHYIEIYEKKIMCLKKAFCNLGPPDPILYWARGHT
ncbi:hypothetical protein ACJX0J_021053 [Zea mays]